MYRTEDQYNIEFSDDINNFDELYSNSSKSNDIDYEFPLDKVKELLDGNAIFHSTYKVYKKFLFVLYKIIGAYEIGIVFDPEEGELGYQLTTEVTFTVNEGSASFELNNLIEPDEELDEESEEFSKYKNALDNKKTMFEDDKILELDMSSLNMEEFLTKLGFNFD